MRKKLPVLAVFLCSAIALAISIVLFYHMGVYVDEAGTSPSVVCGGDFWLYMDWARLALLGILTAVSGFKLFFT